MNLDDLVKTGTTIISGGWATWIVSGIVIILIVVFMLMLKKWRNNAIEAANIKKEEERQATNVTENQELEDQWKEGAERIEEKRSAVSTEGKKKRE